MKPIRWRCHHCGERFSVWAAAQRHAHAHGGARIEMSETKLGETK